MPHDDQDGSGQERTARGDPLIGLTVGEFVVKERIGVGGAGIVYRGEHPSIGKSVAIKVLRPELAEDPEQIRALLEEARIVTAIGDRGIVDVFGFGKLPDGRQYLVMEYLQGDRLDTAFRDGRPQVAEALGLVDQILRALASAHAAGVIHRDLKPHNIFVLRAADGSRYIKLVDFGLARRLGEDAAKALRGFQGTPSYASPEQLRAEPLTPRADLFSVGAILFELLTGAPPYAGTTAREVIERQQRALPPSMSKLRPELPAELDGLVARLLAPSPGDRPASAEAVRAELSKLRKKLRIPTGPQRAVAAGAARGSGPRPGNARAATEPEVRSASAPAGSSAAKTMQETPAVAPSAASDDAEIALAAGALAAARPTISSWPRLLGLALPLLLLVLVVGGMMAGGGSAAPEVTQGGATPEAQLLSRIDQLIASVQAQAAFTGRKPDEAAMAELRQIRLQAAGAKGPLEAAAVTRTLNDWERRHLRR